VFWDQLGSSKFSKGIIPSRSTVCEVDGCNVCVVGGFKMPRRLTSVPANLPILNVGASNSLGH
jgi:hypothetical protein